MNEAVTIPGWVIALGCVVLSALFGLLAWLGQQAVERVKKDLQAARTERDDVVASLGAAIRSESEARHAQATEERRVWLGMYERAQASWVEAIQAERVASKEDRHEFRQQLTQWVNAFHAYKLEASEKFVSFPRLTELLQAHLAPITKGIADIEAAQERIFERVDAKADRT